MDRARTTEPERLRPPFNHDAQLSDALDGLLALCSPREMSIDASNGQNTGMANWGDLIGAMPQTLPDFPYVTLFPASTAPLARTSTSVSLLKFLQRDLLTPDLERMAPHLWMMSTQSSANISPLHHQAVKGRRIVITEDPQLHLVWIYDKIFVKPLPRYLLSWAFWDVVLCGNVDWEKGRDGEVLKATNALGSGDGVGFCISDEDRKELRRAAEGYLRSYVYLIRHPSDLALAHEIALLPPFTSTCSSSSASNPLAAPQGTRITLAQFHAFAAHLLSILDSEVSQRYAYGELRLTRLNFYCKIILRRWHFLRVHTQYGEYFSRFYGPLLFCFTVLSLILNALQVEMAVEQVLSGSSGGSSDGGEGESLLYGNGGVLGIWVGLWGLSRYVAVVTALSVTSLAMGLVGLLTWFHADEWKFAIKERLRNKRKARLQEQLG